MSRVTPSRRPVGPRWRWATLIAAGIAAALAAWLIPGGAGHRSSTRSAGPAAAPANGAPGPDRTVATTVPADRVTATTTAPVSPTTAPVSPTTAPVSPTTASPGATLSTSANVYLADRQGTVVAAVEDLRTGRQWMIGSGRPQAEASVVKLDVLETLLFQHQGRSLSAADQSLASRMIEYSDNDAATALWDEAGGAADIRAFNAGAGLGDTSPSPCVECPGFPWPGWGLTTTVPADQIRLLHLLVDPGPLLTAEARTYVLGLMENVTPSERWGVSAGVPAGATVALKNGWLPLVGTDSDWQVNSVGWVSGLGRDYLIAVLSTGNPTEQYGIDTIDGLSVLVWLALG
jgi:Beta-lactamase enzyme family